MTDDALNCVLLETLVATGERAPVDPHLIEALALTVAKHQATPLLLEPIATQWVQQVLRACFGPAEVWSAMASSVARTLCEDPQAKARLHALCDRLQGGKP